MKNHSLPEKPSGFIGIAAGLIMLLRHRRSYRLAWKTLNLNEKDRFLEIGFGVGRFLKKASNVVSFTAGIDHSEEFVKYVRLINKIKTRSKKMDVRLEEASNLSWEDECFTCVAAIEAFYYFQKPKKSLLEMYRVLRKSGRVVITMIWYKCETKNYKKIKEKYNAEIYSVNSLKVLLDDVGFKKIRVQIIDNVLLASAIK